MDPLCVLAATLCILLLMHSQFLVPIPFSGNGPAEVATTYRTAQSALGSRADAGRADGHAPVAGVLEAEDQGLVGLEQDRLFEQGVLLFR